MLKFQHIRSRPHFFWICSIILNCHFNSSLTLTSSLENNISHGQSQGFYSFRVISSTQNIFSDWEIDNCISIISSNIISKCLTFIRWLFRTLHYLFQNLNQCRTVRNLIISIGSIVFNIIYLINSTSLCPTGDVTIIILITTGISKRSIKIYPDIRRSYFAMHISCIRKVQQHIILRFHHEFLPSIS